MKPGTAGIPGLGSGGTRLAFGGPLRRPIGAVGRSCRGGIGHRQRRSQTTGRRPSSEIAGRGPATAPATAVRRVIASRVRRVCRRARGRNSRAESRIGSANICPRRLVAVRRDDGVAARHCRGEIARRMAPPAPPAAVRLAAERGLTLRGGLACGDRSGGVGGWGGGRRRADPVERRIVGGGRHRGRFLGRHFRVRELM